MSHDELEDSRVTAIKEMRDDIADITVRLNDIIANLNELAEEV